MNKHKFAIIINCNDTPLEKLKEYLQFVVLPGIETGNETEQIKIEGNSGSWSAYFRPLKEKHKEVHQIIEFDAEPVEEPKQKFSWIKTDTDKLGFIEVHRKDFELVTELRRKQGVLDGSNQFIKDLGDIAREKLRYSKKSSCRDIVTLLHNLYLKNKNNDN